MNDKQDTRTIEEILTQEVIDKALEDRWRGLVLSCIICGRRTM